MTPCILLTAFLFMACHGAQDPGFISWSDFSGPVFYGIGHSIDKSNGKVILVSKDGDAQSSTVQGAVDMVPDGNNQRVKIVINPGVYKEKVFIPITKPYITFMAKESTDTVISWNLKASDLDANGALVGTLDSATVTVESDYFCANGVTFENSGALDAEAGQKEMQAVALRLAGDKAMIYRCRILGSQDTLYDHMGRHYFYGSYIEGSVDFIFGMAKSLYEACTLHSIAKSYGAVAASQRNSPSENSGFSFLNCKLNGSGQLYLGRAWGKYSKVVYSNCELDGIVLPEGWSDWNVPSRRGTVTFGEFNCYGKGADQSGRVPWAKSLTPGEEKPFLDRNFVDGNQWLNL